jgi:hypothetical protein
MEEVVMTDPTLLLSGPSDESPAIRTLEIGEFVQIRRTRRGTISRDGYVKVLTRDRRKRWVRAGVLTKYCARPLRADPDSDVQPTESEERWDRSASAFVTLAAVCPNSIRRASSSSGGEDRADNEGFRPSGLPATRPARLPARRRSSATVRDIASSNGSSPDVDVTSPSPTFTDSSRSSGGGWS